MKVALKNVRPNPFRDMDAYPIHPQKIEQLKKSIASTDFWDNVVARKSADPGCIEIAYGHHRLTALRELYGPEHEFTWIVRDLDDQDMIKIMAHENLDEWGHDSAIERETVKAIVQAYGADRIALQRPQGDTPISKMRHAPSFCFGAPSTEPVERRPYTADTIVSFLGGTMSINTVKYTLRALCLIEQGFIAEDQMKGLSSNQARTLVDETARAINAAAAVEKKADRESKAAPTPAVENSIKKQGEKVASSIVKNTVRKVADTLQSGGSQADAKSAAVDAKIKANPQEKEQPEINDGAKRVAASLMGLLDPEKQPGAKLEELIKYRQYIEPSRLNDLDRALEIVIEYAEGYRLRLSK